MRHKLWTLEDWKRELFSAESKINRLGSDERKWAQKFPGKGLNNRLVEGILKFIGGSVMI